MTRAQPDNQQKRRWLHRAIPILFYALLAVFLVFALVTIDWSQLSSLQLTWWPLIAATILSLLFRYLGVFIWLRLLYRLGGRGLRGHYRELTYIYAKSWLGRYIPGAATWILGKIYFAGRHGVPRSKLAVSGVLEGALQIVATLVVGIALIAFDARAASVAPWLRWAMVGALILGLVALLPPVFRRLLRTAFRLMRRGTPAEALLPRWGTMAEATGLYVVGALVTGASYYLVVISAYPDVPLGDALYVIGAASLASAISMLAVFAPGGLGVREGALALLLAVVVPPAIAAVLVVFLRLWSIAVDLIFFAVAWLSRNRRRNELIGEPQL
ncbi:flippase-like domain-containing protein [Microbacterium sp. LRZ72]|uniref:lysylphosphatidylglycerol synthase domain-containing protein n=1 Tax=Microbacterium sp. LRZ72 TaxID=2942481 RepID=UPI0029A3B5A6|nr:lysylphosphatidylglycerol synthase domain-containing protein [Microbacterium sp. LRZ72]MDX2377018.1 flippase-like domain-containing protein [Microbacterium sp. LRZ72]